MLFLHIILVISTPVHAQWALWTDQGIGDHGDLVELSGVYFLGADQTGVQRSFDNGLTWDDVTTLAGSPRSLHVHNGYLFAGTTAGIYRSNDLGDTWEIMTSSSSTSYCFRFRTINGSLFALRSSIGLGQMHRSYDDGLTWVNVSVPNEKVLDVVEMNGALYTTSYQRAFRSYDIGGTWSQISPSSVQWSARGITRIGNRIFVFRQPYGIYYTSTGTGWTVVLYATLLPPHSEQHRLDHQWWGDHMYTNWGERIMRTTDGMTWEEYDYGLPEADTFKALRVCHGGNSIFTLGEDKTFILDAVTSVGSPSRHTDLNVFPNPTDGPVTIQFDHLDLPGAEYRLQDVTGRLVDHGVIQNNTFRLDHPGSVGLYLLTVCSSECVLSERIIFN